MGQSWHVWSPTQQNVIFPRMYPVVSMNGRVFLDRDVTIGGYKFPKNVGLLFLADGAAAFSLLFLNFDTFLFFYHVLFFFI